MADKTVRGRFVWHELMTPDSAGAHAFYTKTLGWKSQPWDQDPSYTMFAAASGPLGGSVEQSAGVPHWLPYLGTTDIEAAVQQATNLGGSVIKELTAMSTGSKHAVLADPQGAAFGVYWSSTEAGKESAPKRGEFSWHELATTDSQAALKFYSALFGWDSAGEHDMGEMGIYRMFGRNGVPLGGIFDRPAQLHGGPAWLAYVRVKDVHQTAKKVKSARGSLVNGPMEVPGGDWVAQFMDPYGTMFAVHTLASDLKAAESAAPATEAESAPAEQPAAKPAAKKAAKAPAKQAAKKAAPKKAPAKKAAAKKAGAGKSAKKAAGKAGKKASKKKTAAKSAGKGVAAKRAKSGKGKKDKKDKKDSKKGKKNKKDKKRNKKGRRKK